MNKHIDRLITGTWILTKTSQKTLLWIAILVLWPVTLPTYLIGYYNE